MHDIHKKKAATKRGIVPWSIMLRIHATNSAHWSIDNEEWEHHNGELNTERADS